MEQYLGLFISCFLAGTVLPVRSEVFLFGMFLREQFAPWLLILVGSAGNVLGATVNWSLGRLVAGRPWSPVPQARMRGAEDWYRRYGRWSLLLAWLPFLGDPLTLLAGLMRERLATFLLLVAIAKVGRYVALAGVNLGWL
jgi:membrane protein YqaA with SNARE-associated domain